MLAIELYLNLLLPARQVKPTVVDFLLNLHCVCSHIAMYMQVLLCWSFQLCLQGQINVYHKTKPLLI